MLPPVADAMIYVKAPSGHAPLCGGVGLGAFCMRVDLEAVRRARVETAPYPHFVARDVLAGCQPAHVARDFPRLDEGGLFLADAAPMGPALTQIVDALESEELRALIGEKLGLDLAGRPTLVMLRSRCQLRDGRIHADSKFKLATLLLYLNEPWMGRGGRLRVLNSGDDLQDYAAEIAPDFGTLVGFRVQENSWHGHEPFEGPRSYVMVNYCTNEKARDAEAARHRMSARMKKVKRLFAAGAV